MLQRKYLLGCVADDFTGASDAASFLRKSGMRTVLINEVQEDIIIPEGIDAIVIALKSRTQETSEAVADVLSAIRWLQKVGAGKFYFKYCSTFDSTKRGNIGPVADAVMEYLGQKYTILCPSLPVNQRVVKGGRLFVNGIPLDESPMKNHPLTPMWDSRIKNLIEAQSRYKGLEVQKSMLDAAENASDVLTEEFCSSAEHFYVIPDYADEEDGKKIAELFGDLEFLTGGSGILEPLAERILKDTAKSANRTYHKENLYKENRRPGVVFAGSCSVATLGQIACYQNSGKKSYKIDPIAVYNGTQTVEDILNFVLQYPEDEVLIYSSDQADNVKKVQELGREKIAELLESVISSAAVELVKRGYGRVIVAGGETSGAVTKALGYRAFEIEESVAPGVPIMIPVNHEEIRLVLKSGNFGQPDFFDRALHMTRGQKYDE